jgi:ribonucleoside-diphosphate reductase alpha subunit
MSLRSFVINRHGEHIPVLFDTITSRNEDLRSGEQYGSVLEHIDSPAITAEVVKRFRNGMTTRELDIETAAICADRSTHHSDYEALAGRIYISDLHKQTPARLDEMIKTLGEGASRISAEMMGIITRGADKIAAHIDTMRDYKLRPFGYQTLAKSYLMRGDLNGVTERVGHFYMRVALGLFVCQPNKRGHELPDDIFNQKLMEAFDYYDALSTQRISNATPTLLNAGTNHSQLSSCFQLATGDDLATLFDTLKSAALISKWSGGISLWLHNLRAEGAKIMGTAGECSGIKRYVKILNEVQLYVDQGGKRPGAFALYLSVDHDDIFTFLAMGRLRGEEALHSMSAPDIKYALWVSDLFMETLSAQLENDAAVARGEPGNPAAGEWYLFSPDTAPGLHLAYGDEYRELYTRYVKEGRARRKVLAGDIISAAFQTWTQVGVPYVLFKDAINKKSNMKNVASICSSNLCTEILIPSWSSHDTPDFMKFHPDNIAPEFGVCNLAAICLGSFVRAAPCTVDYEGIIKEARRCTVALNKIIDLNYYPTEECRRSNTRHRPIGIGIMGLADVFAQLKLAYGSPAALDVARAIAACVYFGAMTQSIELARDSKSYDSFQGSPASFGEIQPDMWDTASLPPDWSELIATTTNGAIPAAAWEQMRADLRAGYLSNAYVTAYMPTATTSNIVSQNECFEPFTSNIYTRKTLAGEFMVVNSYLMRDLIALGLWNSGMRRRIIAAGGSIANITSIPEDIRRIYRTSRELHPTLTIRTAAAMAPFICQSMSMNLFLEEPNLPKILRFLIEGWRAGLKTGMYYCHTQPAAGSQKTSVMECTTCVL